MYSNSFLEKKAKSHNLYYKFSIWFALIVLCAIFSGNQCVSADSNRNKIILPQKTEGIEKIEYVVDGSPRGSTDGKTSVNLKYGSTINFLVKIKKENHTQLHVKDIRAVSDFGDFLKMGVYRLDKNGKVFIDYLSENDLINPNQVYVSEPYTIFNNAKFTIQGVVPDTFDVCLKLDNSEYTVNEALDITFQEVGKETSSAQYCSENNSYLIKNITANKDLKIKIKIKEAFSQSNLKFFNENGKEISFANNLQLSIPSIKKDNTLIIKNVEKNRYSLVFKQYPESSFLYKKEEVNSDFAKINDGSLNAVHGENFLFKFESSDENLLNDKEITVNGVVIRPLDGVYRLQNITQDDVISVKNKVECEYQISLPNDNSGAYIKDESDTRLNYVKSIYGGSFSFTLGAKEGYTQGIDAALVYAVPTDKLDANGDYDISANPDEANRYLLTPTLQGVFTLSDIKEPISLVIKNLQRNVYTVYLPETLKNGSYTVEETDEVKKGPDNTYSVLHGANINITVTPDSYKSVAKMNFSCSNQSTQLSHSGNIFTAQNITSNSQIYMDNICDIEYNVIFDNPGALCSDEYGRTYQNNKSVITHKNGILKFKVAAKNTYEYTVDDTGIDVQIKSGQAVLTKPENPDDYYTLSDAENDITLSVSGIKQKNINISVNSSDSSIKIKSASKNEDLPKNNIVAYGSNFDFKVEPPEGTDMSDISVVDTSGQKIEPIDESTHLYSLQNISENQHINVMSARAAKNSNNNNAMKGKDDFQFKPFSEIEVKSNSNRPGRQYKISKVICNYNGKKLDGTRHVKSKTFVGHQNNDSTADYRCEKDTKGKDVEYCSFDYENESVHDTGCTKISTSKQNSNGQDRMLCLEFSIFMEAYEKGWYWDNLSGMKLDFQVNGDTYSLNTPSYIENSNEFTIDTIVGYNTHDTTGGICKTPQLKIKAINFNKNKEKGCVTVDLYFYFETEFKNKGNEMNLDIELFNKITFTPYARYEEVPHIVEFDIPDGYKDKIKFHHVRNEEVSEGEGKAKIDTPVTKKVDKSGNDGLYKNPTYFVLECSEDYNLPFADSQKDKDVTQGYYSGKYIQVTDSSGAIPPPDLTTTNNYKLSYPCSFESLPGYKITKDGDILNSKVYNQKKYYLYKISNVHATTVKVMPNKDFLKPKKHTVTCTGVGSTYHNKTGDETITQESDIDNGSTLTVTVQNETYYKPKIEQIIITENCTGEECEGFTHTTTISPDENGNFANSEYKPNTEGRTYKEKAFEKLTITKSSSDNYIIEISNISGNITITTKRTLVDHKVRFVAPQYNGKIAASYSYWTSISNKETKTTPQDKSVTEITIPRGENLYFTVKGNEGYDITNITVYSNNALLSLTNRRYIVQNITEDKEIKLENIKLNKFNISFTQYEQLKFKSEYGQPLKETEISEYGTPFKFKIALSDEYSDSKDTMEVYAQFLSSGETKKFETKTDGDNQNSLYVDENGIYCLNVATDVRIYVDNLIPNNYKIVLKNTAGITYYDEFQLNELKEPQSVTYNNNFSFRIVVQEGYDISNIKVYDKSSKAGSNQIQLLSTNGIYTLENVCADHTITISNVAKSNCTIEFRTVEGVNCVDNYGNKIENQVEAEYGLDYSFKLSLDSAYNKSNPEVTIKGTTMPLSPNPDGSYTIPSVKDNVIVEILNVTKNTYTAKFIPVEGVIYKNSKNKPFTDTLDVEYNGTLYFKVSLLDAYDQSNPLVLLNDEKTITGSGGLYTLENVQSDIVITVKNVKKNPEEITMDDVNKVPKNVISDSDINDVVTATLAYNSLSDDEKNKVTNISDLQEAQHQAGELNHTEQGISISGVDWYIKLVVKPLSGDKEQMNSFAEKVDRRTLLSLYEIHLLNLLTDKEQEVPYGQKISVNMPTPDLTGYKNTVVAHEKKSGSMEYLDANIVNETAQFETSSFSLFGIAAKKIPNYSENPSDIQIAVSNLVENEEELETLLGDGLVSKLGNLIDDSDESDSSAEVETNTSNSITPTDSNDLYTKNVDFTKIYSWAIDHEFLSVVLILVAGSLLIWLIVWLSKRNSQDDDEKQKTQK